MKVLRIFAKKTPIIIIIICLLVLQATCDLKLPEYTANIINTGIANKGIENTVPIVLSDGDYLKIQILLNEEEKYLITKNYQKLNINNFEEKEINKIIKKYEVDEEVYIYNETDDLTKIFNKINTLYLGFTTSITQIQGQETFMYLDTLDNITKEETLKIYETEINKQLPTDIKETALIRAVEIYYQNANLNINEIQMDYIISKGLVMVLLACTAMILTITVVYLAAKTAALVCKEFRRKIVEKTIEYSSSEYERLTTSSLITRSTNDIQQVQTFIVIAIRLIFYAPILGIGAYLKVSDNQMNWIIILSIIAVLIVLVSLFTLAMPKFKSVQTKIDKLNLITREILTGIPVIRAFGTEKHEEMKFDKANEDLTKTTRFIDRIMSAMFPLMMFIMNGVAILIVWAGARYIDNGTMQIGDILATITYSMQIIMSFLMFSMISVMMPRAIVSLKRINEVLKTDTSIKNSENPIYPKNMKGLIKFENITFKYPNSDELVIDNLNFEACPGTTTAIIGSTGSGKSTILNLIPRLYDPTSGKITIDNNDIKDIDVETLRDNIGYVPQKNQLFSGTINSNIGLGLKRTDKKKIETSAEIAQADNFIQDKEKKYDSIVSQAGINFSGGQKQRLSIARAIVKNPKIYLFDDSFAALDYKTDIKLRKELSKIATSATIIIVAQRISTIKNADQILVIDEGKIVGIGKHKELLKTCDIYKELATSQLSKEELYV